MITLKEIESIDTQYFNIIEVSAFFIVLQSRNTGHYWHLLRREPNNHISFFISHKHHISDPYHPQACRGSIKACCVYIKEHDKYHISRKRGICKG